ncbi:hypothetical protein [Microcoleus sp. B9-D4]|uniref:hypothetical protein n=1 Tax=Microcoleus sp. B9-D4 TaxID=2818711 RepID=UPI002FCFB8FE
MFRFLHEHIIPAPVSRTAIAVPGSGIEVGPLEGVLVEGVMYIWDKPCWAACWPGFVGGDAWLGRQALE